MYYSHKCTYCSKVFYTEESNKSRAAQLLYEGIKKHLIEYGEDDKEYQMDEAPRIEINQMYAEMTESEERPYGAYEV